MKLAYENENYKLYQGDVLNLLEVVPENSIDSIVTDPPYGLTNITKHFGKDGSFQRLSKGFMGKEWDGSGIEYNPKTWENCYKVLKPGGYLLAFGGTRTFHRIAVAIENAGFEIRDTIMWLYGSGFPKSFNIGLAIDKKNGIEIKNDYIPNQGNNIYCRNMGGGNVKAWHKNQTAQNEWNGWGTALKPAYEPIIVARKPFKGSCVDNVLKYGVGGINIDECRVGTEERSYKDMSANKPDGAGCFRDDNWQPKDIEVTVNGRFPANLILTYDDEDFEEVCGDMPDTKPAGNKIGKDVKKNLNYNASSYRLSNNKCPKIAGDNGGSASRYFYCAKASKRDRDEGLEEFTDKKVNDGRETPIDNAYQRGETPRKNIHPTVKPTSLMQYLVRLVTPPLGTVLDPFMGSGSTGKAVMYESKDRNVRYKFIGVDLEKEYIDIAKARIDYAIKK